MDARRDAFLPRMTPRWKWTLGAVCATAVLGWFALVPRSEPSSTPARTEVTESVPNAPQPSAAAPSPAAAAPAASAPAANVELRTSTLRALASDNSGDRIEALRAVRDRHAVALLPDLLALDVAKDPELAPTLITVATDLANKADDTARKTAAARLATWLRSESQRGTADARGNQSLL